MNSDMNKIIKQRLTEIETAEQVRILHCAEAGSRAWGFASPDSDYDVRFIYVRSVDDYLRLDKRRDVIEYPQDGVFDINGWDLQKALRLLHTSNPTMFEWNNSPIIYKTTALWASLQPHIDCCFLQQPGLYHYLNMAKGNYREYLKGETVRLKKYLYVVRPLLACQWILERQTPPPVLFDELRAATLEADMMPLIDELLERKKLHPETAEAPQIMALNRWIEDRIEATEQAVGLLKPQPKPGWERLNDFFLQTVHAD